MIETWYNQDQKSKKELAELLHKSERTIRRKINRGLVDIRGYLWEEKQEYSAMVAQEKYEYQKTSKGPELKLDSDIRLVEQLEKENIDKTLSDIKILINNEYIIRSGIKLEDIKLYFDTNDFDL